MASPISIILVLRIIEIAMLCSCMEDSCYKSSFWSVRQSVWLLGNSCTFRLEPTCVQGCFIIILDVVAFLGHGRSTGSMHAFHKGLEMEYLELASPTELVFDTTTTV